MCINYCKKSAPPPPPYVNIWIRHWVRSLCSGLTNTYLLIKWASSTQHTSLIWLTSRNWVLYHSVIEKEKVHRLPDEFNWTIRQQPGTTHTITCCDKTQTKRLGLKFAHWLGSSSALQSRFLNGSWRHKVSTFVSCYRASLIRFFSFSALPCIVFSIMIWRYIQCYYGSYKNY